MFFYLQQPCIAVDYWRLLPDRCLLSVVRCPLSSKCNVVIFLGRESIERIERTVSYWLLAIGWLRTTRCIGKASIIP